jgi:signal transduction histidine kinase
MISIYQLNDSKLAMKHPIILFLVLIGSLAVNAQTVNNGIIRLQSHNELNERIIDLSGNWQFYFGKHLSAAEMQSIPTADKEYIKNPSAWNYRPKNDKKLPSYGIATYYLKIVLNKRTKSKENDYGFKIGNIITSYKLWVNGKLVGKAGNASSSPTTFKPIYLPQTCFFQSDSDTLNVVLQVSNFSDPIYAGVWQKIYFGKSSAIEHLDWIRNSLTFFILSAFILFFFYQFTLSFIQADEKSHRIIAILSLFSFIKLLMDGDISVFNFMPNLDFNWYYRLWIMAFLIIPIALRLTKNAYPSEVNKWIEKTFYIFYAVMTFFVIFIDIHFVLSHLIIVVYATFVCSIYMFYVLLRAVGKGRKYSIISFISFTVMILFILNDLAFLTYQFTYGYLSHIGIFFYIITQSMTVTLKFASSHKKVIILSNELLDTNRNLETLVAGRTKELNDANKELASLNKQKDFLISTISHDLMGFFNTLITFTKQLSKDTTLSDKQHKTMSKLYQTSNKGFLLLDNILTWAKMQISNEPEQKLIEKLSYIVDENLYLFAEQIDSKGIVTDVKLNDRLTFLSDIGNLNTIVRNLISNAIKFSHDGGKVTLTNQLVNGKVRIIIHDEGIGMTYNELATVFDAEKTKKRVGTAGESGSGLGLMIVKELVENNNGKIFCTSQINNGTHFIIEFPGSEN